MKFALINSFLHAISLNVDADRGLNPTQSENIEFS